MDRCFGVSRSFTVFLCNDHDAFTPPHRQEDKTRDRLESTERAEGQLLDLFWEDGHIRHIPEAICKCALDRKACGLNIGKPLRGCLQGDVCRVLITYPSFALPWLQQGIKIRRGEDQRAAFFGNPANFGDRFFGVRQMLNNVFNDHHIK